MSNLSNKQKILFVAICIVIGGFGLYYIYGKNEDYEMFSDEEEYVNVTKDTNEIKNMNEEKIIIHITGCVKNQGIIEIKSSARIKDAVDAAGGLTDSADLSEVNLAYQLEDGMKIYIPSKDDNDIGEETQVVSQTVSSKVVVNKENNTSNNSTVNINTATQTELETLPGIGPSIALKIVKYREENGKFSSIEDIKNVSGIGDSKYESIKDFICVK